MQLLLDNLRISAVLRVAFLAGARLRTYDIIVRGIDDVDIRVEQALGGDRWWESLKFMRRSDREGRRGPLPQKIPSKAKQRPVSQASSVGHDVFNHLSKSATKTNLRIKVVHPDAISTPETPDLSDDSDDDGSSRVVDGYFSNDEGFRGRRRRSRTISSVDEALPDEPSRPLLKGQRPSRYGSDRTTRPPFRERKISIVSEDEDDLKDPAATPLATPSISDSDFPRLSPLPPPAVPHPGHPYTEDLPTLPKLEFNDLPCVLCSRYMLPSPRAFS